MEREKQNYDFENLQSQLDKALGQSTRMQKERETIQLEVDRLQDKYEKAQVSEGFDGSARKTMAEPRLCHRPLSHPADHNAAAAEGEGRFPGRDG